MRMPFRSFTAPLFLLLVSFIATSQASAQNPPRLDYMIGITNAEQHLFHIKIAVSNASGRSLDISMPAWTPGWYTIRAYSANVIKLQAHDNGKRLPLRAIDKQSYRIETGGLRAFTIEYDYFANELSVNGAELNAKRGYFVGTNLFFYVPGNTTNTPSNVKFELPAGWRIATGLKKANEPNTFTARNFDNLVDCPVVLGEFDEDVTTVDGKSIHVVVDQKGGLSEENRTRLKDMVQRVIDSQSKMFGGLPYNDYWVLFVGGANLQRGGALEHENSTNLTYRQIPDDPRRWIGTVAHEHFHAWNVKRLKPAGLVPYDYSREQYIQELWFAEGVTSYYADVHLLRSGLSTAEEFVARQGAQIGGLQSNEARLWISLDDASTNTWQTYTPGGPFTVNYYNKGQVLGFMLDLEIRGATAGRKSLDDVLRYLYENNYQRGGKGYTNDDVERVASDMAGKSMKEFFARYVHGTSEIDYNAILKNAGWRLESSMEGRQGFRIIDLPSVTDSQRAVRASLLGTSGK